MKFKQHGILFHSMVNRQLFARCLEEYMKQAPKVHYYKDHPFVELN